MDGHDGTVVALSMMEVRRRYGVTGRPVEATRALRRPVSTGAVDGIDVDRWVLINDVRGTVTRVTTYDGVAGGHFDADRYTTALSETDLRADFERSFEVPVGTCPVARAAEGWGGEGGAAAAVNPYAARPTRTGGLRRAAG